MQHEEAPQPGLQRKTNWWGAFAIGLASTILVTGVGPIAVQSLGAASIPVFFFCVLAALVLCLCLAELAAMMPHRTGGMPSYAAETFALLGPNVSRHLGGISAWGYWLAWFPVAPINMIIAAKYIVELCRLPTGPEFTPISVPVNTTVVLIAIAGMLVMFVPCLYGVQLGARFATACGILSMAPITLLVFLPLMNPQSIDWQNVAGFKFASPATATFRFVISWIFIMSWSVLALEAAACYVGECRQPARDAKIAMTLSGLYGGFIYLAVPLVLLLVLGTNLAGAEGGDPLLAPLTAFLKYTDAIFGEGTWVRWAIAVPLVLALVFSVLHAIMGCGRSLYQVAQDGLLPNFFRHTNRHGVPDLAMAFNLVCSIVVVFFGSPLEIYIFSIMGYLLSVSLALIGYFVHRQWRPDLPRPVRLFDWVRFVALALGVFFLFVWIYGGYYASDIAVAEGKRWLFYLGLGILLLYVPLYAYRRIVEDPRALAADARERAAAATIDAAEISGTVPGESSAAGSP